MANGEWDHHCREKRGRLAAKPRGGEARWQSESAISHSPSRCDMQPEAVAELRRVASSQTGVRGLLRKADGIEPEPEAVG